MNDAVTTSASAGERALAWAVHAYTAFGAVLGLAALVATVERDVRAAFLLMAATVFIDSTDGTLARAARVKQVVPEFDGTRLDDVVDYFTWVLVPIFFAWHFEMFPSALAFGVAALPVLASAYGFCQKAAKTADHFFTGFPSYWNIAVYYLYALGIPPWLNAAVVALLSVAVFVPIGYVYPSRNPVLRAPTIVFGGFWGVAVIVSLLQLPTPSKMLVWASLAFPVWYFALSFYLHARRSVPAPPAKR